MIRLWNGSYKKLCCVFLACLFICFFVTSMKTDALYTTFESNALSKTETERILNNISFEKLTDEPPKRPFECFDVIENGEFVIGFSENNQKTVLVYNKDSIYQYGYKFRTSGSFYLKYDKQTNNLVIFNIRGQNMITVNKDGIVRIDTYNDTSDTGIYFRNEIDVLNRSVDNYKYEAKNKTSFISKNYTKLVRTEKDGSSLAIYCSTTRNDVYKFILFAVELLVILLILVIVVRKRIAKQGNGK